MKSTLYKSKRRYVKYKLKLKSTVSYIYWKVKCVYYPIEIDSLSDINNHYLVSGKDYYLIRRKYLRKPKKKK